MILEFDFDTPYQERESPKRKVNVPQTSRDANESVKEHKQKMYNQILDALREIKIGATSEEISAFTGIEHSKIWKRMSELVEMKLVFNVGITRPTKSNRQAMVRQLCSLK